jgi:hypothetical protein
LSQKISEVIGPEAREILFQAIANGSVVSWQHINLLGEYDFSDEMLQDSVQRLREVLEEFKAGS